MVDSKTKEFLEATVRKYFTPENLHVGLRTLEDQLEEAEGKKKLVLQAFVEGIRQVLGKV